MQDLLKNSIVKMEVDDITPDILESYNMMVKHETFKKYHEDIKQKIAEYNELHAITDVKHEVFKIEPKVCDFYKTINGSILFLSAATSGYIVFYICKLGTPITKKQVGVYGASLTDAHFEAINKIGTAFHVNYEGKFLGLEACPNFGLHVVSKVNASFDEQKENKA